MSSGDSITDAVPADYRPEAVERRAFREGMKVGGPALPGVFAWGMVTGMAMIQSGLTIWQALGMTFIVFAGSAQLAALPLIAADASIWIVFATALIVNLRFVIFGVTIGPHFAHLPWHKRLWYGFFNADITIGLFPRRFPAETIGKSAGKVGFFTGIGYSNWCAWQSGSVGGILLASRIPESWNIGFAGTLALLCIMIPLVINAAALAGVVAAGIVAIAAASLPYRLGLLCAVILGMVVAMIVDTIIDKTGKELE